MREIKFRQPIFFDNKFYCFHYWGFIDDVFVGPDRGDQDKLSGQFTGLLDKNNKEIYEGDIVEFKNHKDTKAVVKYKEVVEWSIMKSWVGFDLCINGEPEVIGNIYDNPELLEEK